MKVFLFFIVGTCPGLSFLQFDHSVNYEYRRSVRLIHSEITQQRQVLRYELSFGVGQHSTCFIKIRITKFRSYQLA